MPEIAILGAGVMGSAMTVPAAAAGCRLDLVGTHLDEAIIRAVAGNGQHPGLRLALPEAVRAHSWTAFGEVMAGSPELLILGVSSAGVEWAVERLAKTLRTPLPVLMITKGLAATADGIAVLPRIVRDDVRARSGIELPVMAVGGPCIAGELAAGRTTAVVLAGSDQAVLDRTAAALGTDFYHVRTSDDVVGVEVCAAFKNFFALAVGAAAGWLERDGQAANGALMHNPASALFTQALGEMAMLVEAIGGRRETAAGLAGAGDLYVTSMAGRNSRMGRLLGLGQRYSEVRAGPMAGDTVEGAELARTLAPTLRQMMTDGRLRADRMPLTRSVIDAVADDALFAVEWNRFFR